MSKLQSLSSPHGRAKITQISQPQSIPSAAMEKALSSSEEFKSGFPSEGLSTVSNRWWGSGDSGDQGGAQEKDGEDEAGTDLLMEVRKKVAEQGREARELGVFRGYGYGKLGKKERALLLRIFDSSAPQKWSDLKQNEEEEKLF